MRSYYSPYQLKVQSILNFKVDSDIQFLTLYENGILPIYKFTESDLSLPIEQYFKIEFSNTTTDMQLIRQTSPHSV